MVFNRAFLLVVLSMISAVSAARKARGGAPCDIYASGGTPCVAAHSTTRSLLSRYNGPLYSVVRDSDSQTLSILPLTIGGMANSAEQDSFCAGTTCKVKTIFDQTGRGNHLTLAPPGGAGGANNLAIANAAPVTVGGHKAYGVLIPPGVGYRNDNTNGIATANQPQGIYAVFDATHYNDGCCFDYGNAETNNLDNGAGHMEAVYFGNNNGTGFGSGNGPWIMADMENGLFSGYNARQNSQDASIHSRFVTAIVKGDSSNLWSLRGGNSQSGSLTTFYSGQRPNGYYPMKKEGAIILGIGGDNSHGAQGTFYEGVMTSGYPDDAIENAVQANIVAAQYQVA